MSPDAIDLPDPTLWAAFTLGYEWGHYYGIGQGRRELAAELISVGEAIRALPRGESHAELERRRTYRRPPLTPEQIHAQAAASWAEVA